jgi:hypothetical protein
MSDDKPTSIEAARFYRADKPEELNPRTALVAALEFFDDAPADDKPTHIIVLVGRDVKENQGGSGTKFFQAGAYRHHGQMGLCLEAMHMIRDSGK